MKRYYSFLLAVVAFLVVILASEISKHHMAFALSPPFSRQEILDPVNDWQAVAIINKKTGSINLTQVQETTEICKLAQGRDSLRGLIHPPDIEAITYLSDGKTLNATLWLSSDFSHPPNNASSWLVKNLKDAPWYVMRYGMSVAVHSVYDTEGTDYSLSYRWDANNNTWTKTLRELSPYGEIRYLGTQQNYSVFEHANQSYVDFSMDLEKLNYPDQYDLLFYVYDYFKYNNKTCPLSDITQRVYTPAPQFDISTSPSSIEIRPSEERDAKLQFKSNASIKSLVQFSVNTTNDFNNALIVNFSTDRFSVPPYGVVTSNLDIKAKDNAMPGSYTLPIIAHIDLPTESKPRRGVITGEFLYNTVNQQLTNTANLTTTVLPSLTIFDYVYNTLNTWGSPIRNLVEIIIVVGGAVGAGGLAKWAIMKIKKTKPQAKT